MKTMLELFSGSGIMADTFEKAGYETLKIDINTDYKPDITMDILKLKSCQIKSLMPKIDVIWSSPPCECFSVASISKHWRDGKPRD